MEKLSVVIITYNEEKNIQRCLDSVKEIADEIVVVDSFSHDRTEEICQQYQNLRFIKNTFAGHIEQKNFAKEQTTHKLVLSLDADEACSKEMVDAIQKIKQTRDADGYIFNRRNNYCGKWIKHSGWYPDKKLRLWDRKKGNWGGINPHDKFEMKGCKIKRIQTDILHYSYNSIEEHIAQINKFSSIGAHQLLLKGKKPGLKIYFSPKIKFLRDYLFKLGFMDGYYGYIIAKNSAFAKFAKYTKLKQLIDETDHV